MLIFFLVALVMSMTPTESSFEIISRSILNQENVTSSEIENSVREGRQASQSCNSFWSYQKDHEIWGLVKIPNPNYSKNVFKIVLSLEAHLPSVKSIDEINNYVINSKFQVGL